MRLLLCQSSICEAGLLICSTAGPASKYSVCERLSGISLSGCHTLNGRLLTTFLAYLYLRFSNRCLLKFLVWILCPRTLYIGSCLIFYTELGYFTYSCPFSFLCRLPLRMPRFWSSLCLPPVGIYGHQMTDTTAAVIFVCKYSRV
jgi:hypothetical protein